MRSSQFATLLLELWLWRRRHDRNKFAYLTMYLCTCLFHWIVFISQSFSSCQRREMIWFVATWTLIIFHFFPTYLQTADSKIIPGFLRQVWQANWLGIIEKCLQKRGSYIFRCCSRSRPRSLRNGPAPLFCSLGHCRQNIVHTLLVWVCNIVSEKTTYSFFGEHLSCVGDEQQESRKKFLSNSNSILTDKTFVVIVVCYGMVLDEIMSILYRTKLEFLSIHCFCVLLQDVQKEVLLYSGKLFRVLFQPSPCLFSNKKYKTVEKKVN